MKTQIMVEGPDCSGKSMLVDRLKNTLHWDAKSLHHKPGDQFHRYLQEYAFADHLIFDRGHLSEHVYATLWRGGTPFSAEERRLLDQIQAHQMLLIFVNPPLATLQQRYLRREFRQQISFEELERSQQQFQETLQSLIHLVYTAQTYTELDLLVEKVKGSLS